MQPRSVINRLACHVVTCGAVLTTRLAHAVYANEETGRTSVLMSNSESRWLLRPGITSGNNLVEAIPQGSSSNAHAGSRTRVTSMGGLYDAATLRARCRWERKKSYCFLDNARV